MKKLLILAITLGVMSCKKEEVSPIDKGIQAPITQPPLVTNHVSITVNSVQAMDSMVLYHGGYYLGLTRTLRDNDQDYPCNITRGLYDIEVVGDCNTKSFELIGTEPIEIVTNGDVTIEYK